MYKEPKDQHKESTKLERGVIYDLPSSICQILKQWPWERNKSTEKINKASINLTGKQQHRKIICNELPRIQAQFQYNIPNSI